MLNAAKIMFETMMCVYTRFMFVHTRGCILGELDPHTMKPKRIKKAAWIMMRMRALLFAAAPCFFFATQLFIPIKSIAHLYLSAAFCGM